jgi:hypothetical protein
MTNTTPTENISSDPVNHPSHYTQYPVEVIELTRHMTFTRGNSVKYIARAGFKGGPEKELEDLKKARWYIDDDIKQLEMKLASDKPSVDAAISESDLPKTTINMYLHPSTGITEEEVAKIAAKQAKLERAQG